MSDDNEIPSNALCSSCGAQRGDHSGGTFYCPDSPASDRKQAQFSDATFAL